MPVKRDGEATLEATFLEMRARTIELAAALDRIERAPGGAGLMSADPRIDQLRQAFKVLDEADSTNRAERVQLIFSLPEQD